MERHIITEEGKIRRSPFSMELVMTKLGEGFGERDLVRVRGPESYLGERCQILVIDLKHLNIVEVLGHLGHNPRAWWGGVMGWWGGEVVR